MSTTQTTSMVPASSMAADQMIMQLRAMSQPHVAQQQGKYVGIVLNRVKDGDKQPFWTAYTFDSAQAMKEWYDDWLGNEYAYAYLAAIDRTQSMDPIYEAGLGQRRTRMNPDAMVSGARTMQYGPFDALRELVANHETYWAAVAQRNPTSQRMRWWMTQKWDPFFREWINLVAVHGLSNSDTEVLARQLLELNRLRREAYENEIPVPPVSPGTQGQTAVSGGGFRHGGGGHGGGGMIHRPFPRPRPRGWAPRGFGYGGYDGYYGDVIVDPYAYVEEYAYAPEPPLELDEGQDPFAVGADHRSPAPPAPIPAPAPGPAQYGHDHRPAPPTPIPAPTPHPYAPPPPAPIPAPVYGRDHRPAPPTPIPAPAPAPAYGRDHRAPYTPPAPPPPPPYVRDHRGAPQAYTRPQRVPPPPAPVPPRYTGYPAPSSRPGYRDRDRDRNDRWSRPGGHGWHGHRGGWGRGGFYRPGSRYPGKWTRGASGPVWLESDVLLLADSPPDPEFANLPPPSVDQVPLTPGDPNDQTQITDNGDGTVTRQDDPGDAAPSSADSGDSGAQDSGDVSSDPSTGTDDGSMDDPAVTQGNYMYSPLSNSLVLCGRPFSPIVGDITIDAGLSPDNILTVTLQVEGRTYVAHADLTPLVTSSLPMIDQYVHPGARSLVGALAPTDQDVRAIRAGLVGRLLNEYQDEVVSGWLDDIGHAVKSAAVGVKDGALAVHHAVAGTVQKFKGPITVVATAVATAYGGPLAGAAAAKFCGPIIDGVANVGKPDHPAQKQLAAAHEAAKTNPQIAAGLAAAKAAVANTVAGYHIKQTLANAASGDPNAAAAIKDLAAKAKADNPAAKSAWDIATGLVADAASSYIKSKTSSDKLTPEEEAQIEIDPPSTVNGVVSGVANGDPRAIARAAAMATKGNVIGVVLPKGNPIQVQVFGSSDDADDWYGQWLSMPHAFEYVAYYDRGDASFPGPLNETLGAGARAFVSGGAIFPFLAGLGMGAGGYYGGERLYRYWKDHKPAATKASGWSGGRWTAHLESDIGVTAMYGER